MERYAEMHSWPLTANRCPNGVRKSDCYLAESEGTVFKESDVDKLVRRYGSDCHTRRMFKGPAARGSGPDQVAVFFGRPKNRPNNRYLLHNRNYQSVKPACRYEP